MIHNDHLGTPQKMTDASGTVVWTADYKPFGEATITVSTITNNLRFPGQYYDAETGLNYNYARDYNPVIGRYVEADPIGINYGQNHLYVYVNNTPLMKKDPSGLFHGVCGNDSNTWIVGGAVEIGVPDNPNGIFLFTVPCATHDSCYGCDGANQGKSKSQCDGDFLDNMKNVCQHYLFMPILYLNCMNNAYTYYYAVARLGDSAFKEARKDCPSCSK
jgi:RHS repeat-associated protein